MYSPIKGRYFYDLVVRAVSVTSENTVHSVSQVLTMLCLVAGGRGIAFVPATAARLGISGVKLLALDGLPPDRSNCICSGSARTETRPPRQSSSASRVFAVSPVTPRVVAAGDLDNPRPEPGWVGEKVTVLSPGANAVKRTVDRARIRRTHRELRGAVLGLEEIAAEQVFLGGRLQGDVRMMRATPRQMSR